MQLKKTIYVVTTLLMTAFCGAQLATAAPVVKKTPQKGNSALQITSPKNGSRASSPLVIKGTAASGNDVSVNVKATFQDGEQDLGTFRASIDKSSKWQTTPINLWAPEEAKNIKYEIVASQRVSAGKKTQTLTSGKVVVSPPQKMILVPRNKITQAEIKKINPTVDLPARILPNPIDPITGTPRPGNNPGTASTTTQITSPSRNNSTVEIPILIKGTAQKNSNIKVEILTTYKKYGETSAKRTTAHANSDGAGKWQLGQIFSIRADEADDKVTHKIDAYRVEGDDKKGNTATITVLSDPVKQSPVTIILPTVDARANKTGHVRGKAVPGSEVEVQVTVSGTNSKGHTDAGGVAMVKDWQTVTAGSNGTWATPSFNFDSKGRVRNIKFHITARSKNNPRDVVKITVEGR